MQDYKETISKLIENCDNKSDATQLYNLVSQAAMEQVLPNWQQKSAPKATCYFSAEFLIGRVVYANLFNLGLLPQMREVFQKYGLDANAFEGIDDDALGNGGLGRLAACFLDSGATCGYTLNGYGIRYKYGLFKQYFENGFQKEEPDDWTRFGDPWSIRKEQERVLIHFKGDDVWAVPYDMPVIGYGAKQVNTLRLWQAEAVHPVDFTSFNKQDYETAYQKQNEAESISAFLYPNDDTNTGKKLRLKQQYFFSAASLHTILYNYKKQFGENLNDLPKHIAIQLNDTHPTVSIVELLRILIAEEGFSFEEAFVIVKQVFAYTNHTIMAEALEKWDIDLFCDVIPEVYPYVVILQNNLQQELKQKNIWGNDQNIYNIISDSRVHMARMAVYATHSTNGVAALHTEILKNDALKEWYILYPERFNNKTNGITPRRWLALCNPQLSAFITQRIGDAWIIDLNELKKLEPYANDSASLAQFMDIKRQKKIELANHVRVHEYGFELNIDSQFDVQVKRLHEYKRQFLNALATLDIYFSLKDGTLKDFAPMTILFGAKASPGYKRAKGIIKFINEIAKLVNNDLETNDKLQVLFVQNYNVSYAEKLIPAADLSEQISTAGTEASGTGNMKLMLNGAPTLGTYDGANVEIVEESGEDNNFIFGANVADIEEIEKIYDPKSVYLESPRIKRVLDTLVDGTFDDDGTGIFKDLYSSILQGAAWHKPDQYYLLLDFTAYVDAKLAANKAYQDKEAYAKKCLLNIANAGKFSSDRTIHEYAKEIWGLSVNQ